jgi:hypothetical protein
MSNETPRRTGFAPNDFTTSTKRIPAEATIVARQGALQATPPASVGAQVVPGEHAL